MEQDNSAGHIRVLRGLDMIRRRPGMFIRDLSDEDLTTRVFCLFSDYAFVKNRCSQVRIFASPRKARVWFSKALPVGVKHGGVEALTFFTEWSDEYSGFALLNALAQRLKVTVYTGNKRVTMMFDKSELRGGVEICQCFELSGTELVFRLDEEILPDPFFDIDRIRREVEVLRVRYPEASISATYDHRA